MTRLFPDPHHRGRVPFELLTGGGQSGAGPGADEQDLSQLLLQCLDPHANGGLGDIEPLRRRDEVSGGHDLQERSGEGYVDWENSSIGVLIYKNFLWQMPILFS